MSYRVHIKAPVEPDTKYGRACQGLIAALERCGCYVTLTPMAVRTPVAQEVAAVLTRAPEPPYDVLMQFCERENVGLTTEEESSAYRTVLWTDGLTAHPQFATGISTTTLHPGYSTAGWDEETRREGPFTVGAYLDPESYSRLRETFLALQRDFKEIRYAFYFKKNPEDVDFSGLNAAVVAGDWSQGQKRDFLQACHCFIGVPGVSDPETEMQAAATGCIPVLPASHLASEWSAFGFALTYDSDTSLERAILDLSSNPSKVVSMSFQAANMMPRLHGWDAVAQRLLSQYFR